MMPLHPDHLANLREVKISDETIEELEIYTAVPGDISRLLQFHPPDELKSLLVFSYAGEDGFFRGKTFPAIKAKDGSTIRYLQPPNSGVHLYIHPRVVQPILSNPYVPLAWTENERCPAVRGRGPRDNGEGEAA